MINICFIVVFLIGKITTLIIVPEYDRQLLNEYDFVIIGSGSAGSVLANRLSEVSEWKILLLEAGRRPGIISDIPALAQTLQATDYNWNYRMEKTPNACLGSTDQKCVWPRGKGLGGSTLINYMIYTRGNKLDYNKWAESGNPGWSYEKILKYFKKSERSTIRIEDEGYHGKTGEMGVEDVHFRNVILESFISGGRDLGYDMVDYNGKKQEGFGYVQSNSRRGVRQSGFRSFIRPVEFRKNLYVSTRSRVVKILIDPDSKKAYGVVFAKNKMYLQVNVSKEVVLSAGTFNSPQLLMLSGVGPRKHLESLGIPVVNDLPGVGQNLKDHLTFLGMVFKLNSSVTEGPLQAEDPRSFKQWVLSGTGPLTDLGGVSALAYIHTNITQSDVPDMELIFASGKNSRDRGILFKASVGISKEIYDTSWKPIEGKNFWSVLPMLLHPKSVRYLELKSKNPFAWPKLQGNYLSDPGNLDMKTFIATVRFIQKLAKTQPFLKYGSEPHNLRLEACQKVEYDSDEYWKCVIRQLSISLHHQTGTCKMGPKEDKMAVVDNVGQVYGIRNLRVADCSIIPEPLSAHTNAPGIMIGEKIADDIKNKQPQVSF